MDVTQAERLARAYLAKATQLVPLDARPVGTYWLQGVDEHLSAVRREDCRRIGGDDIVAVDKATGAVRWAGYVGE